MTTWRKQNENRLLSWEFAEKSKSILTIKQIEIHFYHDSKTKSFFTMATCRPVLPWKYVENKTKICCHHAEEMKNIMKTDRRIKPTDQNALLSKERFRTLPFECRIWSIHVVTEQFTLFCLIVWINRLSDSLYTV